MSDLIFTTDGKETFRMPSRTIQELTIGTKTTEIQLEVKKMNEIEKTEEDNPNLKKIIDKMVEERKSQKLWNMVRDELGYSIDCCDEIVDLVEKWLPKEQSAEGSQNAFAIDATEGFNHCLNKMKGMLR
jgi:hypothetical protein